MVSWAIAGPTCLRTQFVSFETLSTKYVFLLVPQREPFATSIFAIIGDEPVVVVICAIVGTFTARSRADISRPRSVPFVAKN